jgi:hypothetical protein
MHPGNSAAKAANGNVLSNYKRAYSFEDERRTITALRPMRDAALARGEEPDGPALVFDAIRFLVDIDRNLPDEKPSQPGNAWVAHFHDAEEKQEALKQRMIDIAAGDDPGKVFKIARHATAADVSRSESIEKVFRAHLDGEYQDRDWNILWYLASKPAHETGVQHRQEGSLRSAERKFGLDKRTIGQRRDKQLGAIWKAIEPLMPPALTKTSGVVWPASEAA